MRYLPYLFHSSAYYLTWFLCIYLAAHNHGWAATFIALVIAAVQLIWQIRYTKNWRDLFGFIITLTLLGCIVDTLYLRYGLIYFNANPFSPYLTAPWMASIWLSFAVTLYSTLKQYLHLYLIISILSFVGFALAYYIGAMMDAAYFPHGMIMSFGIGLTWAILLPLFLFLFHLTANTHD